MGLLSIIRKQKLKERELRVLLLGLDNSGKSTIVLKLLGLDTSSVSPTMGFQIHRLPWKQYNLSIWDIGGQTTLRAFWSNYFDRTDVVIWVIDASSIDRLHELYEELREKVIQQDRLQGLLFLLLINKIDLVPGSQVEQVKAQVSQELNLGAELSLGKYHVQMTSGVTGDGLHGALDWIVEALDDY